MRALLLALVLAGCTSYGYCATPEDRRHCALSVFPDVCFETLGYERQPLPCPEVKP